MERRALRRTHWIGLGGLVALGLALWVGSESGLIRLGRGDDSDRSGPSENSSASRGNHGRSGGQDGEDGDSSGRGNPRNNPWQEAADRGLSPRSRVWGLVTDDSGQPIPEAVVALVDRSRGLGRRLEITQTNFDGIYQIINPHVHWADMYDNLLTLTAEAPGRARLLRQTSFSWDTPEVRIDFVLPEGGAIAGQVIWEGGQPVGDADVIAYHRNFHRQLEGTMSTSRTNADGMFRLENLDVTAERVLLSVAPPGEPYQSGGTFDIGDEDVLVVLGPREGVINGRVVWDRNGEPVPGALVWCGDFLSGWDAWTTTADGDGQFRFEKLPPEIWWVRVPQYPDDDVIVGLSPSELEKTVEIRLGRSVPFSGVVVDLETGLPVPNLGLTAYQEIRNSWIDAPTDANGRFQVSGLQSRDEVSKPLYERTLRFRLPEGEWFFTSGQKTGEAVVRGTGAAAEAIRLEVRRGVPLTVLAVDDESEPVPEARMVLFSGPGTQPRLLGTSDTAGVVSAEVAPAPETLQVLGSSAAYPLLISEWFPADIGTVVAGAIPPVDIEVHVIGANGRSISGVDVSTTTRLPLLSQGTAFQQRHEGVTDGEGIWRQTHVAASPQMLTARLVRDEIGPLPTVTREVDLTGERDVVEIEIQFEEAGTLTLEGEVVDRVSQRPIALATIAWGTRDVNGQVQSGYQMHTDTEGRFSVTVDENQVWLDLEIIAAGHSQRSLELLIPEIESMRLELDPLTRIIADIANRSDQLWGLLYREADAGWGVSWELEEVADLSKVASGGFEDPFLNPSTTSSSATVVEIEAERLRARNLLFLVSDAGDVNAAEFTADPSILGQEIDLGTLTLVPGSRAYGRVIDAGTQEEIAGALVELEIGNPSRFQPAFPHSFTVLTDESGHFEIFPLSPNAWNLRIGMEGYESIAPSINLPDTTRHDYPLSSLTGRTVTVALRDAEGDSIAGRAVQLWDARGGEVYAERDSFAWGKEQSSNGNGAVVFESVPPIECHLRFLYDTGDMQIDHRQSLEVPEGVDLEIAIDMSTWHRVSGEITRGGLLVEGAFVKLFPDPDGNDSITYSVGYSDRSGLYEAFVPRGWYYTRCNKTERFSLAALEEYREIISDRDWPHTANP